MISCLCPTYGRAPRELHLLEECVESYLRADRPRESELVILNDCPGQILKIDSFPYFCDDVRIVNLPYRLPSLGDKFNLLVELARGDILLPWEDDDISLPHRINQAITMLETTNASYFNPGSHWLLAEKPAGPDGVGLFPQLGRGVNHNASAFTREAWKAVGGYPRTSGAQDAQMDQRLRSLGRTATLFNKDPRQWQYIYRWGVSSMHLSGVWSGSDHAYELYGKLTHAQGEWGLKPRWRRNYELLIDKQLPTAVPAR